MVEAMRLLKEHEMDPMIWAFTCKPGKADPDGSTGEINRTVAKTVF